MILLRDDIISFLYQSCNYCLSEQIHRFVSCCDGYVKKPKQKNQIKVYNWLKNN